MRQLVTEAIARDRHVGAQVGTIRQQLLELVGRLCCQVIAGEVGDPVEADHAWRGERLWHLGRFGASAVRHEGDMGSVGHIELLTVRRLRRYGLDIDAPAKSAVERETDAIE